MKSTICLGLIFSVIISLYGCAPNLPGCSSDEAKSELNTQLDKWIKESQISNELVGKVVNSNYVEKRYADGWGDMYVCKGTISWLYIKDGKMVEFEKSEHLFHIIKNPFVKYDEFEISWTNFQVSKIQEMIQKSKYAIFNNQ